VFKLTAYPDSSGANITYISLKALPPPPTIFSLATAQGNVGQSFTYQILATDNPFIYAATNLPPGLTLDTVNGLISGTPLSGGNFNVGLTATNDGGSGMLALTLSVNVPPMITMLTTQDNPGLVG